MTQPHKTTRIRRFMKPLLYSWCGIKATMQALKQRVLMIWLFHFNPNVSK